MAKKPTLAKLKKKLWELCKQITRARYGNTCYTCSKSGLSGHNQQTGHGKPKGALSLKYQYDLRNLKIQCIACNYDGGGMSDIFIAKLEKEKEGKEFLKESCVNINGYWEIKYQEPMGSVEAYSFVLEKIAEYEKTLKELK